MNNDLRGIQWTGRPNTENNDDDNGVLITGSEGAQRDLHGIEFGTQNYLYGLKIEGKLVASPLSKADLEMQISSLTEDQRQNANVVKVDQSGQELLED